MKRLDSITDSMDMNLNKLREIVEDRGVWRVIVHEVAESDMTSWLNNNKAFICTAKPKWLKLWFTFLQESGPEPHTSQVYLYRECVT